MRAIVVKAFGGPETLELVEAQAPIPARGQVLIAVEAAGVGLGDVLLRRGVRPDLAPGFTPGLEMAGTVVAVGEDVNDAWLNSRIFAIVDEGTKSGCYAELVVANVDRVTPLPPTISSHQAVSLGVNALVAEFVTRRGQVKTGEHLLVRGASGGIGVMAVQVAARRGAIVTASTSSPEHAEHLVRLGASYVVDRAGVPFGDGAVPEEFDVILDPVAGPDMLIFCAKLRNNGRVVLAGIAGGLPPAELASAIVDSRSLTFSLLSLDAVSNADRQSALREIFASASRGELKPVTHEVLDLKRASDAHANLESGKTFGKIVLEVATGNKKGKEKA